MRGRLVGAVAILGAVVAVAAAAGPAFAGGNVEDVEPRASRPEAVAAPAAEPAYRSTVIHETPPFADMVAEDYHGTGAEFGLGLGSTLASLFYTPFRMVIGFVGAELGGIGGWSTGADMRTARAFWRPMVEGDYYIRPDHLDRTEPLRFMNTGRVVREYPTLRGREPIPYEDVAVPVYEAPVASAPEIEVVTEPAGEASEESGAVAP